MVEPLPLHQFSQWKHAGKDVESVVSIKAPENFGFEEEVEREKAEDEAAIARGETPKKRKPKGDFPVVLINDGDDTYFNRSGGLNANVHPYNVVSVVVRKEPRTEEEIQAELAKIDPNIENEKLLELAIARAKGPKDIEMGYLVPHYKVDDPETSVADISRRDTDLLSRRATKFFYFSDTRKDMIRTRESIQDRIDAMAPAFTAKPPENEYFNFENHKYRDLPPDKRKLVLDTATLCGHMIARVEALGKIIIAKSVDLDSRIKIDQDYVDEHMNEIIAEFRQLDHFINSDAGQRMFYCVRTDEGERDNDKVFAHIAREICKPVRGHIPPDKNIEPLKGETPEDALARVENARAIAMEGIVRHNIVQDIGSTMLAIDQVYKGMRVMMDHDRFTPFAQQTQSAINRGLTRKPIPTANGLDINDYRGMMREYVNLCRAQVGIRTEDEDQFDAIESRLDELKSEINFCHKAMQEFAQQSNNKVAQHTIPLLKRGFRLITEMNEIRLPRNEKASGLDGAKSTVERFTEKVQELLDGNMKNGPDINEY